MSQLNLTLGMAIKKQYSIETGMQLSETVASINCHAGNLVNQTNNSMKKRNER